MALRVAGVAVVLLAVAGLALALGGGSGGDHGAAGGVAAGDVEGSASAFCRDWPALSRAAASASGGSAADVRASFEQASAQFRAVAGSAPAELRVDFATYAEACDALAAVLWRAD